MYEELVELLDIIFKDVVNVLKGNICYVLVDVFVFFEEGSVIMFDFIISGDEDLLDNQFME